MKFAEPLFGLNTPIIQAPMAGVQGSALALAVSNCGALGSLPCAMLSTDQIEAEIKAIRAKLSGQINLNFFCHHAKPYDQLQAERWHKCLQPHFDQFEISPRSIVGGGSRSPFSHELADIIEPYKPFVLSFHFGLPAADLLARVLSWGIPVISTATTVSEAKWLESNGVSAVIAQGLEAGGHRGMFLTNDLTTQSGTFALLPQIAAAVSIPVIAAGGISTAGGVRAALSMGASAVQCGTAFLLCDEAKTSEIHRRAVRSDASQHTAITNVFSGKPARGIVNKAVKEIGPFSEHVMDFPHCGVAMTALRSKAEAKGAGDYSPLWCGQNATGCSDVSAVQKVSELYCCE